MLGLLIVCFILPFSSSELLEVCNKIDTPRIVGGEIVNITHVPYQLSLEHPARTGFEGDYSTVCGAAIIGKLWGISAAHCVAIIRAQAIRLRCGISSLYEGGSIHNVVEYKVHPQYERKSHRNDIALLKVDKPFEFTPSSQPIKLAQKPPAPETLAVVSGWGMLKHGGEKSRLLQQVFVYILDAQDCVTAYGKKFSDGMLCAGYPDGGRDACQGDSGGPLMVEGELVGIVSWGEGCANPEYPGVYTDISYFRPWILSETGGLEN